MCGGPCLFHAKFFLPRPICSTAFLVGPMRQFKNMFANRRIVATMIFLVMMILTLVVAIKAHSIILSLMFIILQFLAFV